MYRLFITLFFLYSLSINLNASQPELGDEAKKWKITYSSYLTHSKKCYSDCFQFDPHDKKSSLSGVNITELTNVDGTEEKVKWIIDLFINLELSYRFNDYGTLKLPITGLKITQKKDKEWSFITIKNNGEIAFSIQQCCLILEEVGIIPPFIREQFLKRNTDIYNLRQNQHHQIQRQKNRAEALAKLKSSNL